MHALEKLIPLFPIHADEKTPAMQDYDTRFYPFFQGLSAEKMMTVDYGWLMEKAEEAGQAEMPDMGAAWSYGMQLLDV